MDTTSQKFREHETALPEVRVRREKFGRLNHPVTVDTLNSMLPGPGTRLACYEIVGTLGSGGMGSVYRARDTRLGREVAVKLLSEAAASQSRAAQRFMREALAASALNHPNIITVFEYTDSEFGPILVTELIEGKTLRQLIPERPRLEVALDWCRQMARALSAAHASGIVHRDLKPDNIMVRHDGFVKVLDFGIARLTRPTDAIADDMLSGTVTGTMPGVLLGTLRYMSPEQIRGESAGPPTDVFSMGLVWFELLTNQHPFAADSTISMMHGIASSDPALPSTLNSEVPRAVETLILRMLSKDAASRPAPDEVERELSASAAAGSVVYSSHSVRAGVVQSTVGRDVELSTLLLAYRQVLRAGGHLICIAGEAGIGKTTLAEQFVADLERSDNNVVIGRGRCSERLAGTEAYLPFLESLDSLLQRYPELTRRVIKQHAPMWYLQVGSTTQQEITPGVTGDARNATQERLKRELNSFLRELSAVRPVVLFFDDLHWADASTIDLLNHAANQFGSMRVLVIATYRASDMIIAKHPFLPVRLALQAKGLCTDLSLELLTAEEVESYIALTFPDHSFPTGFSSMLHARTEGNPLFVTDLLRYLRDRGTIAEQSGRWKLMEQFDAIAGELPASVRSMVERKIDQLGEEDRKLLAAASVQGYEFDSAVIAEVLQIDPAETEERLNFLDKVHSFVRVVNEDELPDQCLSVRCRFVHVLYQNAFYASLRPTRRAGLSAAVAASLEKHLNGKKDAKAGELAILYETARLWEPAARYFLVAATNASGIFAAGETAALATRGLAAVKSVSEGEQRLRLNLELEVALAFALRVSKGNSAPETGGSMLRARELSERAGVTAYAPALLWGLYLYYQVGGDLATARHFGEQLLSLGHASGDAEVLLGAHTALGITSVHVGDLLTGHDHLEQAVTFHDPTQHTAYVARYNLDPGVYAGPGTQRTLWLLGYADKARARTLQTLEWCRQFSDPQSVAFVHVFAAFFYQYCREPLEAERVADICIDLCDEHGIVQEREWVAPVRGWAAAKQGRINEGLEILHKSLARHRAMHSQLNVPYFLALLAEILLDANRLDEGLKAIDEALELAEQTQMRAFLAEMYRVKGEILHVRDREDPDVKHLFWRALEVAERQGALALQLRAAMSLFRVSVTAAERTEARVTLERAYASFTEGFTTVDLVKAKAMLA